VKVRIAQLTSPIFIASVAVLALNDHVFKGSGPGVVTGKISDFAGLFVVAALLGVLMQSRVFAIVSAALGFVALKTIPVVAVAAAPLLGGRTRVDFSDLVALLVLAPAWWWLGREHDARRDELRVALGVVSGIVAMLTVTATSCGLHDQVEHLVRRPNGALVAAVREDYELSGAVSRDGRRWEPTRAPARSFADRRSACLADGTCFRVVPGTRVESRAPNGNWRTAYGYTGARRRHRQGCAGEVPSFASLAIAGSGRDQHVVVVMGSDGVLWRASDGRWLREPVLGVVPGRLAGPSRLSDLAPLPLLAAILLAIVVVLAIVVPLASLFIARRFPSGPPLLGAGGLPVAAWHPDPYGGEQERWWDGRDWSRWTRARR
jgi:hypothetical protein